MPRMWLIHEGGAVWPWLILLVTCLTIWGALNGGWRVPLLALVTYCVVRVIVMYMPVSLHEVAICAAWLLAGAIMLALKAWLPGFFYVLSGLTYPTLLIFGARLEYMGLSPIIAEAFAILALLSITGGLLGLSLADNTRSDRPGPLDRLTSAALGMASR